MIPGNLIRLQAIEATDVETYHAGVNDEEAN